MTLKYTQKFKRKNVILQQKLEMFLTWRDQGLVNNQRHKLGSATLSPERLRQTFPFGFSFSNRLNGQLSNDCINSPENNRFKNFYLPFELSKFTKTSVANFFPAKKPFMQFWVFPFLGACFLSFVTSEHQLNASKTFRIESFSKISETRKPDVPLSTETNEHVFIGTYSELGQNSRKQRDDLAFSVPLQVESLCRFYLTFTEKNLQDSFESMRRLDDSVKPWNQASSFSLSQFQKNSFGHFWCVLKNPPSVFTRRDVVPEKLGLPYFSKDVKNRFFSQERMGTPGLPMGAGPNPMISYYRAAACLDRVSTDLYLQNVAKKDKNFVFNFLNSQDALTKTNDGFEHTPSLLSQSFFDFVQNLKQNEQTLKKSYLKMLRNLRSSTVKNTYSKDKIEFLIQTFRDDYNARLFKNWFKKQRENNTVHEQLKEIKNKLSVLNEHRFQILKKIRKKETSNFLESLKTHAESSRKFETILRRTRFLKTLRFHKPVDKNIFVDFTGFSSSNKLAEPSFFENPSKISIDLLLKNRLKDMTSNLILLKKWRTFSSEPTNFQTLRQPDVELIKSEFEIENDQQLSPSVSFKSNAFLKDADVARKKFLQELNLYRKLARLSSKVLTLASSSDRKNNEQVEASRFQISKIVRYQTPILNSRFGVPRKYFEFESKPENSDRKGGFPSRRFYTENSLKFEAKELFFKTFTEKNRFFNTKSLPLETKTNSFLNFKTGLQSLKFDLNARIKEETLFDRSEKLKKFFFVPDATKKVGSVTKFIRVKNLSLKEKNSKFAVYRFSSQKPSTKSLRQKRNRIQTSNLSKSQQRKAEKIFRTYFSIKFLENTSRANFVLTSNQTKRPSNPFVLSVLRKIKNRIHFRSRNDDSRSNLDLKSHVKIVSKSPSVFTTSKAFRKRLIGNAVPKVFPSLFWKSTNLTDRSSSVGSKQVASIAFLQKSTLSLTSFETKRFQQKKALQKKRRLKKLKLENRRRKKRKRFYPRPHFLRYKLYSTFLAKRHVPTETNKKRVSQRPTPWIRLKTSNRIELGVWIEGSKKDRENNARFFKQKLYRQNRTGSLSNRQTIVREKQLFKKLPFYAKAPEFHNQEFYKVSNETLTEFERLCWKSYWLRSNLTPYISRIQRNLRHMQTFEKSKTSKLEMSRIFNQLTSAVRISVLKTSERSDETRHNVSTKQIPLYLNVKQTFEAASFQPSNQSFLRTLENKALYDRLLYERITNEIKNVKGQLNVEGHTSARSYKPGRQKLEHPKEKSFVNTFVAIQNNFFEPRTNRFRVFDPDATLKPFGDLPTLRVLWAFHKSHLFTYKENNFSKTLWSTYKTREQVKNNKTRKFLIKLFKISPFESDRLKNLSRLKTAGASKKLQVLGGVVFEKNYEAYLRSLKFELRPELKVKTALRHTRTDKPFENSMRPFRNWFETNLQTKIQKQKIHFWWTTPQPNIIETLRPLFRFETVTPELDPYIFENINFLSQIKDFSTQEFFDALEFEKPKTHRNEGQTLIAMSFWTSCVLFHVAIFFSLIRIPEIRSLLKFQFLLFAKITNVYLLTLFSFYDLFISYKRKVESLLRKTLSLKSFETKEVRETPRGFFKYDPLSSIQQSRGPRLFSTLSLKTSPSSLSGSSPSKKVSFVQSSLIYRFDLRTRFDFDRAFEKTKSSKSIVSPSSLETSHTETFSNLDTLLLYAMSPFGRFKKRFLSDGIKKRDPEFFESRIVNKNWFRSWYNGFLWYTFSVSSKDTRVLKEKQKLLGNGVSSSQKDPGESPLLQKASVWVDSNVQIQSALSLMILFGTKFFLRCFYVLLRLFYDFVFKSIDVFESLLLLFYKFLEKPAELMVAWIADIYLIEWSSEITSYVPEAFDAEIWQSFEKFSRVFKFFGYLPFGFLAQRFFLTSSEIFYNWLMKADKDLTLRQQKGVIFWDVWAELLLQAAEKYKMNLSSLNTIREEQQLLIENLIENKPTGEQQSRRRMYQKADSFLTSETFHVSMLKMKPLLKFLQDVPEQPSLSFDRSQITHFVKLEKHAGTFFDFRRDLASLKTRSFESAAAFDYLRTNRFIDYWTRWSVNQSLTIQGRDTELFMELNPSKSFTHVNFLKTCLPAQEILGSLVCEISSGLFQQKVSKNILVVGAPGTTKSFFIQALAGETESKVVIDNAHRYAFVNGGVPIGMKLLRDVFDSISLHTPCLFVLEDIHVIGERRPMLISDDETSRTKEDAFGSQQDEIHEKNKLMYQLSRHSFTHYRKPYKGDFSMSIPTNHFCYDLFLGIQPPRKRRSNTTPKSPLPLSQIEKSLMPSEHSSSNVSNAERASNSNLISLLQFSIENVFAPPATSPFQILLMKEQKKLKPKKTVREMPWRGFSYDQYMLISKTNYSVRVKVALLAELAMTNLSIKLDMITDLLVIIDSVRSNRGFVVFGTTHVPSLLDPALRRPGRFDETISLPLLPNLLSRFEIFKTKLSTYSKTIDFLDSSLTTIAAKENETQIDSHLSRIVLSLLNSKNVSTNLVAKRDHPPTVRPFVPHDYSIYSLSQAFQTALISNSSILEPSNLRKLLNYKENFSHRQNFENPPGLKITLATLLRPQTRSVRFANTEKLNYLAAAYAQAGQFTIESLVLRDQKTYALKTFAKTLSVPEPTTPEDLFKVLYATNFEAKNTLLKLFASKIGEFFVLQNSRRTFSMFSGREFEATRGDRPSMSVRETEPAGRPETIKNVDIRFQTNPSQLQFGENIQNFQNYWQSSILFLDSFFQKRFLYEKNTIVSKLLFLEDATAFRDPPSPPKSSVLMPAKKFENYQRTLKDFIQKPVLTINQKLQAHQKQRFMKLLYDIPLQERFRTSSLKNESSIGFQRPEFTSFSSAFKELGYLDLIALKPSSSSVFYQNRFLTRHRFSFLNQWWNGQLAEHTVETTYLSHVDWRSMFVQSLGDLIIDFPDADQYYNPRTRRWFLNSMSWHYWADFEKMRRVEISQHYILQTFVKTSTVFHENREMLDYLAFRFLRYHSSKEVDLLQTLTRFSQGSVFQI